MVEYDNQYKDVLERIMIEGTSVPDRTGVGVLKVFDVNMSLDLTPPMANEKDKHLIPALTLRKVFPRTAWLELYWMLSGSTDVTQLQQKNVKIWDGNSSREFLDARKLPHVQEGHVPFAYGHQFRKFNGHVDQFTNVVESIRNDPNSRRHLISLWNPSEIDETPLPPCHLLYQFVVIGDKLNLKFYQRSADFVLGVPMNTMFAAFLLQFVADLTGYTVGKLSHSIADCHVYRNHIPAVVELIKRTPVPITVQLDRSWGLVGETNLDTLIRRRFDARYWESEIGPIIKEGYSSHPALPREMLVMSA